MVAAWRDFEAYRPEQLLGGINAIVHVQYRGIEPPILFERRANAARAVFAISVHSGDPQLLKTMQRHRRAGKLTTLPSAATWDMENTSMPPTSGTGPMTVARNTDRLTQTREATADFVVVLARVMIGLIFVLSGWPKLLHYQAAVSSMTQRDIPEFLALLGPPVEFFGGLAIVLGVATSYAALLMIAFTIVATASSHRFWEFTDPAQYRAQNTNFWKNVSMMGGMLLLFITAGGRYSIDGLLFRRSR